MTSARAQSISILIGAIGTAAMIGCTRTVTSVASGKPRPVSLAEFAEPEPQGTTIEQGAVALGGVPGPDEGDDVGAGDVWFEDFEDRTALRPTHPGDTVVVDSLVGHVNGRPIFADDFLEPIEDRLLRAAEQTRGIEREQTFMVIINEWLREVILNELILAEAEAGLTEQEQMGLFALLDRVYDEEIRKGGGTKSGAESRLRQEGDELDQYLGKQKDLVLIDRIRLMKIQPG